MLSFPYKDTRLLYREKMQIPVQEGRPEIRGGNIWEHILNVKYKELAGKKIR